MVLVRCSDHEIMPRKGRKMMDVWSIEGCSVGHLARVNQFAAVASISAIVLLTMNHLSGSGDSESEGIPSRFASLILLQCIVGPLIQYHARGSSSQR
jgi:hypothetical protein